MFHELGVCCDGTFYDASHLFPFSE